MRNKSLNLVGLLVCAALLLSACGGAATTAWPGVAADGNSVFLAEGAAVRAVAITSGAPEWTFPSADLKKTDLIIAEPAVGSDVVVVGSEGPRNTYSGLLYGLERKSGEMRWCLAFDQKSVDREKCNLAPVQPARGPFGLPTTVDRRIIGAITLADGVIYFGLASGAVYAVDAASGTVRWRYDEPQRDIWAAPVVADQVIIVASLDHHLYAISRDNGASIWKRDMGAALAGTPTLVGDTLYVGAFSNYLYALNLSSGEELWKFQATNWVWSGPAEYEGILYFTDVGGTVFAVDAGSHNQLWRVKPGGLMRERPAVTAEAVYVGDRSGNLFALNRTNGQSMWTKTMKGQILASPVVVNDLIIVAPFGGANLLEAYTTTGDFKWAYAPGK